MNTPSTRPTPPTLAKSLQPANIERWEPDEDFLDSIPELFPDDSGNDEPAKASEPTAVYSPGDPGRHISVPPK